MKLYNKYIKRQQGGSFLDVFSDEDANEFRKIGNISKTVTDSPQGGFKMTVRAGASKTAAPEQGSGKYVQHCDFGKLARIAGDPQLLQAALASGEVIETMRKGKPVIQDAKYPECSVPAPQGKQKVMEYEMNPLEKKDIPFPIPEGEMQLRKVPTQECYEYAGKATAFSINEITTNSRGKAMHTRTPVSINVPKRVCSYHDIDFQPSTTGAGGSAGLTVIATVQNQGEGCTGYNNVNCLKETFGDSIKKQMFESLKAQGLLRKVTSETEGQPKANPFNLSQGGRVTKKYMKYLKQ